MLLESTTENETPTINSSLRGRWEYAKVQEKPVGSLFFDTKRTPIECTAKPVKAPVKSKKSSTLTSRAISQYMSIDPDGVSAKKGSHRKKKAQVFSVPLLSPASAAARIITDNLVFEPFEHYPPSVAAMSTSKLGKSDKTTMWDAGNYSVDGDSFIPSQSTDESNHKRRKSNECESVPGKPTSVNETSPRRKQINRTLSSDDNLPSLVEILTRAKHRKGEPISEPNEPVVIDVLDSEDSQAHLSPLRVKTASPSNIAPSVDLELIQRSGSRSMAVAPPICLSSSTPSSLSQGNLELIPTLPRQNSVEEISQCSRRGKTETFSDKGEDRIMQRLRSSPEVIEILDSSGEQSDIICVVSPNTSNHRKRAQTSKSTPAAREKSNSTKVDKTSKPKTKSTPNKAATKCKPKSKQTSVPSLVGLPNYSGFTTAQLQTEFSRYGFKPTKSRSTMISKLTKCYEAISGQSPIDIQPPKDPETLLTEISAKIEDALREPVSVGEEDWWGKILRYTPIILEDFEDWLKGKGIDTSIDVLRGWCDKRSICCALRNNSRGHRRKGG